MPKVIQPTYKHSEQIRVNIYFLVETGRGKWIVFYDQRTASKDTCFKDTTRGPHCELCHVTLRQITWYFCSTFIPLVRALLLQFLIGVLKRDGVHENMRKGEEKEKKVQREKLVLWVSVTILRTPWYVEAHNWCSFNFFFY